jgi:hypothetical protein
VTRNAGFRLADGSVRKPSENFAVTIAQQIAQVQVDRETIGRNKEFCLVVKYMMLGGNPARAMQMAEKARAPARVVQSLSDMIIGRAAVDPMSIGSVGTVLSPFQQLSNSFAASLSNSAFDQMLPFMIRLPMRTRIIAATSILTGAGLSESDVKRVGSLSLSAAELEISKSAALIALTREVVEFGTDGVSAYLENELKAAVAVVTDTKFLSLITSGATSMPSSGTNAIAMRLDLRALIQTINLGSASKLFLISTPDIVAAWATVGDSSGGPAFPNARVGGGDAAGVRIIASDGVTSGQIILADASAIAASSEEMRVDSTGISSIQMDSSPDSPATASTSIVNLWTQNMVATKLERFFGAKVVRSGSVALVTGANYSGNSP